MTFLVCISRLMKSSCALSSDILDIFLSSSQLVSSLAESTRLLCRGSSAQTKTVGQGCITSKGSKPLIGADFTSVASVNSSPYS